MQNKGYDVMMQIIKYHILIECINNAFILISALWCPELTVVGNTVGKNCEVMLKQDRLIKQKINRPPNFTRS